MRRSLVRLGMAAGVMTLMASVLSGIVGQAGASTSGLTASAPGITPSTIKIGIFSDLTGAGAVDVRGYASGDGGAFQADKRGWRG